jgi:hypothetical protein
MLNGQTKQKNTKEITAYKTTMGEFFNATEILSPFLSTLIWTNTRELTNITKHNREAEKMKVKNEL